MSDLDPRWLARPDDVHVWAQDVNSDVDEDSDWLIERLNAVSELIHSCTRREIVARNATWDGETRDVVAEDRIFDGVEIEYDDDEHGWVLPVGDMAERPTQIRVLERDGTVVETWSDPISQWVLVDLERRREPWQPISGLLLERSVTTPIAISSAYLYEVTAVWGFPEIPKFVREAAILQVGLWHMKDVRQFSRTLDQVSGRIEIPSTLSPVVEGMVAKIKRYGF